MDLLVVSAIIADHKEVVIMTYREWLPSLWGETKGETHDPLSALRKQIETVFQDFERGSSVRATDFSVRSNVSETDNEICITAELPGIEEKDIDISVTASRITIKGEKKSETEEKSEQEGRRFHRVERSSGSFERSMSLPFDIDPDTVKAEFKKGVLTVTIPKPPEVVEKTKKIDIKRTD